jgi:hypothetical protein
MSTWDCSCVQENSFLRYFFPAQVKSVTEIGDGAAAASIPSTLQTPVKIKRGVSSELEFDDKSATVDNVAADDQTDAAADDNSEDTVIAAHDMGMTLPETSEPLSSPLDKNDDFFKEESEDIVGAPVSPAVFQSSQSTPSNSRPASLRKSNSLLYDVNPVKITVKGDPFSTATPEVSEGDAEKAMEEIAKEPSSLVGWQIELFDKHSPTTSVGVRVVTGIKKMRGSAYKFNVCTEAHSVLASPAPPVMPPSPQSTPKANSQAPSFRNSLGGDEDSDSAFEKWSALKVNAGSNKSGWPFKLLRKLEVDE